MKNPLTKFVYAPRTKVSNFSLHQNHLKNLLKQTAGPLPQSFWGPRPSVMLPVDTTVGGPRKTL